MKKIPFLILTLVIFTQWGCKIKTSTSDEAEMPQSATIEELGQMNRDFAKALTEKNAIAAAELYDENASLLPPNEPIVTGRANIQAYWQGLIDAGVIDATVNTIGAESNGDLGYEIGTYTLRMKGANNDTITETGKYTEILQRNAEGKWISVYGMWSSNEAAPTK